MRAARGSAVARPIVNPLWEGTVEAPPEDAASVAEEVSDEDFDAEADDEDEEDEIGKVPSSTVKLHRVNVNLRPPR
jgi:hypothetical protein